MINVVGSWPIKFGVRPPSRGESFTSAEDWRALDSMKGGYFDERCNAYGMNTVRNHSGFWRDLKTVLKTYNFYR